MDYFILVGGKLVNFTIDYLIDNNITSIYVIPGIPEPVWMDSVALIICNKKIYQF